MADNTIPAGTDGKVPVYDPYDTWKIWNMSEIYQGQAGKNRYVPKLKDWVVDDTNDSFSFYCVVALSDLYVPTLKGITLGQGSSDVSQSDRLLGVGPVPLHGTYRAYINKTTTPYTLCVDQRCWIGGSMSSWCKIFKGNPEDPQAVVVSKRYDAQGRFVSEKIPLELMTIDNHSNFAKKTVPPCSTTDDLVDNEILTAVFYSATGIVVSKHQLLVENTALVKPLESATKYISHISLESIFLKQNDSTEINYPLNVPIDALNLTGVVHYTDGSTVKYPVDGRKFSIFGLDQYVSSVVGQRYDIVLAYNLSEGEATVAASSATGRTLSRAYTIVTVNPNLSYTVKLFGYPKWMGNALGYKMTWWLLNLDRDICEDVTDLVRFSTNTGAYDPLAYGYIQRKTVYLNLRSVSVAYKSFIHTQTVEITLNGPAGYSDTLWTMTQEATPAKPKYGIGVYAAVKTSAQGVRLNIACDLTEQSLWLKALYRNTQPLSNPATEIEAPTPTHFSIIKDNNEDVFDIADWSSDLAVSWTPELQDTFYVKFIRKTGSEELCLSIAGVIVTK